MNLARYRVALLVTGLGLVAAACGSTVPQSQLQQALTGQGQGLGGVPGATSTIPGSAGVPGSGSGASGTLPPGVTGPGGGSSLGGSLGPGITATTIYMGIAYVKNAGAANAAIGAAGNDPGDLRTVYNAMIAQINKEGGLYGRKVAPVYAEFDATSSTPLEQQGVAACATWTQDNKVFGILSGVQGGGVIQACGERARTVNILPGGDSVPDTFRRFPHYVEISGMNLVRAGQVTVKGLAVQNYFDRGAKLGIVTWDGPNYRLALDQGYLPGLRNVGVTPPTPTAYIHVPANFQDVGNSSSDVNSAVLRFSQQGITHVMIIDGPAGVCAGACLGFQFTNQAKSQDYRPRYGFNDYNCPDSCSEDGLYPLDQLPRSVAAVWSDSDKTDDVGYKVNEVRERCYALMRSAGVPMENSNQQFAARTACEQFWFMRQVIAKIGNAPLNNDNFMAGVNSLGREFAPVSTYTVQFSPSQHDGVAAARNMAFFDSCRCYQYTSAPYAV